MRSTCAALNVDAAFSVLTFRNMLPQLQQPLNHAMWHDSHAATQAGNSLRMGERPGILQIW